MKHLSRVTMRILKIDAGMIAVTVKTFLLLTVIGLWRRITKV